MARRRTPVVEEVVVPEGSNTLVVKVRHHDWVALVQDGRELVRDHAGSPVTTFVVPAGTYSIVTDGRIEDAGVETTDLLADPLAVMSGNGLLLLRLSSDAPDQHVIDAVGEIPADGESSCTITIEKINAAGEPLRRRRDNDEVFLRSTGGTIEDPKKDERIRSVKLRSGRASFRLVAEPTPRLVTVSALGAGMAAPAEIQIEFV